MMGRGNNSKDRKIPGEVVGGGDFDAGLHLYIALFLVRLTWYRLPSLTWNIDV